MVLPSFNGLTVDSPYRHADYSAAPLALLDINSRFAVMRAQPARQQQAAPRPQPVRSPPREPLIDEDGLAATCPICLVELHEQLSDGAPNETRVQWTACCGRIFHEKCLASCELECPMCRHDIGLPGGRIRASSLSPAVPVHAAGRLAPSRLPRIYSELYREPASTERA